MGADKRHIEIEELKEGVQNAIYFLLTVYMQHYLFKKDLTNNFMCSTEETRHVSAHISHRQVLSYLYI
jgi:hypothetical protein